MTVPRGREIGRARFPVRLPGTGPLAAGAGRERVRVPGHRPRGEGIVVLEDSV